MHSLDELESVLQSEASSSTASPSTNGRHPQVSATNESSSEPDRDPAIFNHLLDDAVQDIEQFMAEPTAPPELEGK